MTAYVLITGEPSEVKDKFIKVRQEFKKSLPFIPIEETYKISANGKWAICIAGAKEKDISSRLIIDNRGVFFICGPYSSGGKPVEEIFKLLLSGGVSEVFAMLSGSFNITSLSQRQKLVAFSDFTGCYPVYKYVSRSGLRMVSNNPMTLSMSNDLPLDNQSLSWLIGHSNIFMDRFVFDGIERIVPGKYFKTNIGQLESEEVLASDDGFWPKAFFDHEHQSPQVIDWEKHLCQLTQSLLDYSHSVTDLKISLTGGKDSRLILACALNAGLKNEIETFTKGPVGSPEIECARNLANLVGVKHTAIYTDPQATKVSWNSGNIWKTLKMSVFRYSGGICLWDGRAANVNGFSSDITGFGGELYRGPGGHAKQFKNLDFLGTSELIQYWINYHQPHDPLKILLPDYIEFQKKEMAHWLRANASLRRDILPEKFFVENRLSHWNGPLAQQVSGRVKLMPLLNASLAKDVFTLDPILRNAEIAHYELMRSASDVLVKAPFLNDSWSPIIAQKHKSLSNITPFLPKGFSQRKVQSWQWDFVELEKIKICNLFDNAMLSTDVSSFVDLAKAKNFVAVGEFRSVVEVKTIISLVGICLLALGDVIPCNDMVF